MNELQKRDKSLNYFHTKSLKIKQTREYKIEINNIYTDLEL